MAIVVIGNLNGTNLERDHALSADALMNMTPGVRKGFSTECAVTLNQVAPGIVWVECIRTSVSPAETFLVPVWIQTNQVISTSGTNKVFVEVDASKIIDGSANLADGTGIATIGVAASVPSSNALELASITASVITDTRTYAQHQANILADTIHYGIDSGTANAKVVSITGIKALVDGMEFSMKNLLANTSAVTVAVTGLAAKALVKGFDQALVANDMKALQQIVFRYNASADNFEMTSQIGNAIVAATITQAGISEFAVTSEIDAGSDDTRSMNPFRFKSSIYGRKPIQVNPFDFTADVATGDLAFQFRIPPELDGMNLVAVHAQVVTAGVTGTLDIQIHNVDNALDMLSTLLTVDSGEIGSDTAATPAVIDTAKDHVNTNDRIRIDIDAVHTTPAKGLLITTTFQLP